MAVVMFSYYLFDALSLWYFGRVYKKDYTFKQSFITAKLIKKPKFLQVGFNAGHNLRGFYTIRK